MTRKTQVRQVVRTFEHPVYWLVGVELSDRASGKVVETLRGTPEHPFFTSSGLVGMGHLQAGMEVLTRRGPALVVKSVRWESHPEGVPVYNFEVEGDHTYFIGKAQGGTWVHNACPFNIRFTQDSIEPVFSNGPWEGRTLEEAIAERRLVP